jgi:hypothetical protein
MRFMLVLYGSVSAWNALDTLAFKELGEAHKMLQEELANSGELIDHQELDTEHALVVRIRNDAVVVEPGPLANAGAIVGGYYLVDCVDQPRAVEIAGRFKEAAFASVEVRRFCGDTPSDTGAPDAGRQAAVRGR